METEKEIAKTSAVGHLNPFPKLNVNENLVSILAAVI